LPFTKPWRLAVRRAGNGEVRPTTAVPRRQGNGNHAAELAVHANKNRRPEGRRRYVGQLWEYVFLVISNFCVEGHCLSHRLD
jgi:hypothetical protein